MSPVVALIQENTEHFLNLRYLTGARRCATLRRNMRSAFAQSITRGSERFDIPAPTRGYPHHGATTE